MFIADAGAVRRGKLIAAGFAAAGLISGLASLSRAENWPAFRGPDGRSVVSGNAAPPSTWGPKENVRWRTELPGKSNGSPVVWGDRVFVTQYVEAEKRRTVMCFDRGDGKLLWQSGIAYDQPEAHHPDNPYCSGTPATDGQRVVACFGSAGVYCYDFAGKELWHRDLGKLNHMFGNAISPMIVGDRVILNFGPGEGARLVGLDKQSGEVKWEVKPPAVEESEKTMTAARFAGPGVTLLMGLMFPADKDMDTRLSVEEMTGLADALFDKADAEKRGSVTSEQFAAGVKDLQTNPDFAGKFFAAIDTNQDGALKRDEAEAVFKKWFDQWGKGGTEPLDGNQILDGLNALFPPPKDAPPPGPGAFGGATGPSGSWSTPLLVRAGGRDELVVSHQNRLAAYDPVNGKQLWICRGLPDTAQPMPVFDEKTGLIVASGGDMAGGTLVAVRPGGSGDVTETHRVWRLTRLKGSIGTGVAQNGLLYFVSDDGFALCYDLAAGKKLWQKRLTTTSEKSSSWSSALLAGDRIYVPNQSGDVFVLKAGPEFEVLATNAINEPTNASLAASDGQLFVRTDKALWCVGK
jgi:outer membrane protein assembly factor BamB